MIYDLVHLAYKERKSDMKKTISCLLIVILLSCMLMGSAAAISKKYEVGDYYDFKPEIANAMKLNWYSSAENRAMLTLVLGLQVSDDRVMGSMDLFSSFLVNTTYLGRSIQKTSSGNMTMYIALGRYDNYFIYILYSPEAKQASFFLQDNPYGNSVSDMQMELLIAKLCSDYYKNDTADMFSAFSELQSLL